MLKENLLEPDDINDYKHTSISNIKNECYPRSNEWVLFP